MNDADLNKEINRIKNLKNNNFSESEILKIAKNNLRNREFKANPLFNTPEEQKNAEEKFKNYLQNNIIESENDIDVLRSLVYNEVYEQRLQKQINDATCPDPENPDKKLFFSDKLTNQLTSIQNQKLDLKTKLGIGLEQKNKNELTGLQILKKRFEAYINANKHEFTIASPSGEMLLLRRRVKDFDCIKHPFFAGRWLFNYPLFQMVKNKEITKQQAIKILQGAGADVNSKPAFCDNYCEDYIDYCLKHLKEITSFIENK